MKNSAKNNRIPVIIDVDTGIDDAVALSIALACKKLDVRLVTVASGNVDLAQGAKNSLNILHLFKHDNVPVAMGEKTKFVYNGFRHHSEDGIGGADPFFPKHNLKPIEANATEAMADVINNAEQKVVIVAIGPLTNIDLLFKKHPEVKEKIQKLVIMAGSIEVYAPGEMPYFGFNVKINPKACENVINSGVDILISPCDMGHIAKLTWQEVYKTKTTNMAGKIFEEIFRRYHDHHVKDGIAMHDSCAVASVIDPTLFKIEKLYVHMEYYDGNGVLRCEWKEPRNIDVCTDVDIKRFKKLYFKSLKKTKTVVD